MEIIRTLRRYGVYIDVDFGWDLDPYLPGGWVEGAWELNELEIVRLAVEDFSARLGGAEELRKLCGKNLYTQSARKGPSPTIL